jgi:hypothetical protein
MDFECKGVNAGIRKIHVSWPYLQPQCCKVAVAPFLLALRCRTICVCVGNFRLFFAKSLKRVINGHFFTLKPVTHEAHPRPPRPAKKNDRWGGVDRACNRSPCLIFLILWLTHDRSPANFAVPLPLRPLRRLHRASVDSAPPVPPTACPSLTAGRLADPPPVSLAPPPTSSIAAADKSSSTLTSTRRH